MNKGKQETELSELLSLLQLLADGLITEDEYENIKRLMANDNQYIYQSHVAINIKSLVVELQGFLLLVNFIIITKMTINVF